MIEFDQIKIRKVDGGLLLVFRELLLRRRASVVADRLGLSPSEISHSLTRLRDLGNTVLVVEHDEETIRRADYVIDLGPGAGRHGGALVASGTPAEIMASAVAASMRGVRRLEGSLMRSRAKMTRWPWRRARPSSTR